MMKFIKVRVIHSPLSEDYTVEHRSLFTNWRRDCTIGYYPDGSYGQIPGPHKSRDEACRAAFARANVLIAKEVVWEKWGVK